MAYCTVSISGGANDSLYGKSQFPIKSYIEKRGEAFEQESVLKSLFRVEKTTSFADKFSGDTAMDNFEPVGEGGNYPSTGFVEGYSKTLEQMTWKSRFAITREMVEDAKLYDMRKAAGKFMTSYHRTREEFARALYVGGLSGATVKVKGKTFNCASADGVSLFNKSHPAKVKSALQTNLFADAFSTSALSKMEVGMQNTRGDNGELLSVTPDTIWIPNDAAMRDKVFAAIGADKEPTTANNGFNYQYGRWNIIVDPYLNPLLAAGVNPWFLLDSKFMVDQDGPVWLDRVKLEVKSDVDKNNDNNMWDGYARFTAGFVDWRFCAVGGMTGGSAL